MRAEDVMAWHDELWHVRHMRMCTLSALDVVYVRQIDRSPHPYVRNTIEV